MYIQENWQDQNGLVRAFIKEEGGRQALAGRQAWRWQPE